MSPFTRRDFLKASLSTTAAAGVAAPLAMRGNAQAADNTRPPNLVFIFSDQMRGMDMGCAGNAQVHTPNMDRLAAQGTRLTHCYANAPVCTPCRGMLLTGNYPLTNKVLANDLPIPEDADSIGKCLQSAGYRTGYVGKWHLDGVPRDRFTPPGPRRQGFDYWAVWNCSHNYNDAFIYRDEPEPIPLEKFEPEAHTDLTLDFINDTDERPFAMFLSWGPPHDPYYMVPERYSSQYDPDSIELRPNVPADADPFNPERPISPRDRELGIKGMVAAYYAHITALDEQLGRIMDALEEKGLADNTILIYTSDHGDMLWSQGMVKKQQPWEESVNIPFLIRWPGHIEAGATSDMLFSVADMSPTLQGLMGVEPGAPMEGRDLSPAFLGEDIPTPDSVFLMDMMPSDEAAAQNLQEWRGIRTARYTYARFRDATPWVLYDNDADPYQLNNLAEDPAHEDLLRDCEAKLQAWLDRTGDAFLSGREHIEALGLAGLWGDRMEALGGARPDWT